MLGKWLLTRLFGGKLRIWYRRRVADKNLEMAFSNMDAQTPGIAQNVYHNLGPTASELYLQPEESC